MEVVPEIFSDYSSMRALWGESLSELWVEVKRKSSLIGRKIQQGKIGKDIKCAIRIVLLPRCSPFVVALLVLRVLQLERIVRYYRHR